MKHSVKILSIVMFIYILFCLANVGTEGFYIVLVIFSMLQFAVILFLTRSLMASKKIQRPLWENKIQKDELMCTIKQLTALNALKNKLFSDLTHDIRNPMAAMVSMMELLEEDYYSTDSREIVHEVRKQVKKTFSTVENLLEWSKSQKYGLVNGDLSKIAEKTVNVLRCNVVAKDTKIINNMEDGVTIFADKEILAMLLQSFLKNAVKFSRSGGLVSIQTQETGRKVIVRAIDTGIVIDPDKAKALFSQGGAGIGGEKGMGLGTLISEEFAKSSKVEIWMESLLKEGNTFYFSLPSEDERAIPPYGMGV